MAPQTEVVQRRWDGGRCVVVATGPSLTQAVADRVAGERCLAVNDAYRLVPWAVALFANDPEWWALHAGCPGFKGERWSTHQPRVNDKLDAASRWGLRLVRGSFTDGFSTDPAVIHYGNTSTFQAINLAIHFGASEIVLVGCDMRTTTPRHFFGEHPPGLKNGAKFEYFIPAFVAAAAQMPPGVRIVNATPGSALTCFPMRSLEGALCC